MKFIPIVLASFFTFLFTVLALIPSFKFTKAQRNKYPILKKIDGKQVIFFICAIICGFLTAVFTGIKEYVAMQPQTEISQEKKDAATNQTEVQTNEAKPPSLVNAQSSSNLSNPSQKENIAQQNNSIVPNSKSKLSIKSDNSAKLKNELRKPVIIRTQSLSRARSLISQGKNTEAINECDRILRINSNNSEAISLKKYAQQRLRILNQ